MEQFINQPFKDKTDWKKNPSQPIRRLKQEPTGIKASLHLFFMVEMHISSVKSYGSSNRVNKITQSLDELKGTIIAIIDSGFLSAF